MTRPIYEPNLTRKDSYLDFQQQQLFRRPAPTTRVTEFCLLQGWDYTSDNTVPSDVWTDVCSPTGPPDGFMQDAYQSPGFQGTFSYTAGSITVSAKMFCWAIAYIQFAEDLNEGDIIGVSLEQGSGYRIINTMPIGPGGANSQLRFSVAGPMGGTEHVGSSGVAVGIYHTFGAPRAMGNAKLQVVQFSALDDALWQTGP